MVHIGLSKNTRARMYFLVAYKQSEIDLSVAKTV